jgi:hypothetical protein
LLPKGHHFPKRGRIGVRFARVESIHNSDSYQAITQKVIRTIKKI